MSICKMRKSGWVNWIPMAVFLLTILAVSPEGLRGFRGEAHTYLPEVAPGLIALDWGGTCAVSEEISLSIGQSQGGWEQRFEKVYDTLDLYVVVDGKSDSKPIKITWPDRGFEGRYTWSSRDPAPETRSITRWVGNSSQITLRAIIQRSGSTPLCYMDTIYNGNLQKRWELTGDSGNQVVSR